MDINLVTILAAAGGGILGACMGALPAITLWGVVLLIASLAGIVTGNTSMVWDLGFNPIFGAQIVYAGGAAVLFSKLFALNFIIISQNKRRYRIKYSAA